MNRSYRRGLANVCGVVAASALLCFGLAGPRAETGPAGELFGGRELGAFRFVERSGRTVTEADLADRPWIAGFVFTRCPGSCLKISAVMADIQEKLKGTDARLVSISVDPEHDSPAVLSDYAKKFGADPGRWWFLTGPKADTYALIFNRFELPVAEVPESARDERLEAVSHSDRLVLVDRGNRVAGVFNSTDPKAVTRLVEAVKTRQKWNRAKALGWPLRLPTVNATLNGSCAILLVVGWSLIRLGRVKLHAATMIAAIAVSAVFLSCYLVYHYLVGSVPFRGEGPIRQVYLTILLSHTVLAIEVVPLIALTVYRAARGRFAEHASMARIAFPVWLYVSITGVVVYWMLYRLELPTYPG